MPKFTDENIQRMFGAEDAENESPERLKEYFFRNKAYESLTANLPIRILVGHKGSGKSALLKICHLEDVEKSRLAIWLQPSSLMDSADLKAPTFLSLIEKWKKLLLEVIFKEILKKYADSKVNAETLKTVRSSVDALLDEVRKLLSKAIPTLTDAAQKDLISNFLKNNSIRVYIDDLDRGWKALPSDIQNISALLNAVRDLCGHSNSLQFRIGLRTDVYFLVRTSDESTDKIERNVTHLQWTNHDILVLFAKRVLSFQGQAVDEKALANKPQKIIAQSLDSIIVPVFEGLGKWESTPTYRVLLSLTRKRPRDLVKLFYAAAKAAHSNDAEIIDTAALRSIFSSYSSERLQDIINEFKSELPEIAKLLHNMKPSKKTRTASESFLFTTADLNQKLRNIMGNIRMSFTNSTSVTPQSLGQFLYKIDFIIGRKDKDDGSIVRMFFDQNKSLMNQFTDFGFNWEVHPAYRWALQPDEIDAVFKQVYLREDDAS